MEQNESEIKLLKLKCQLQDEIIKTYGNMIYDFSRNANDINDKLQSSRKESVGDLKVEIELDRDKEYLLILTALSNIATQTSAQNWIADEIKIMNKNKEILKQL